MIKSKFTVFFEDCVWIGIYELYDNKEYQVSKIIFYQEPKDYEVYNLFLKKHHCFIFTNSKEYSVTDNLIKNPKRRQRDIHKQTTNNNRITKAQMILSKQRESIKKEKKRNKKQRKYEIKEYKFRLKKEKKKLKHRGR